MRRLAFQRGAAAALIVLLLAFMGVFDTLSGLRLFGQLDLGVLLVGLIAGASAYLQMRSGQGSAWLKAAYGVLPALLIGVMLLGLGGVASAVNLSSILPNAGLRFVDRLRFGFDPLVGSLAVIGFPLLSGIFGVLLAALPGERRLSILYALAAACGVAILREPLIGLIPFSDCLALIGGLAAGYLMGAVLPNASFALVMAAGAANSAALGLVVGLVTSGGGLDAGGILRIGAATPVLLELMRSAGLALTVLVFSAFGGFGALVRFAPASLHALAHYGAAVVLICGLLSLGMPDVLSFATVFTVWWLMQAGRSQRSAQAQARYNTLAVSTRRFVRIGFYAAALVVMLAAPAFVGPLGANILSLVGLYLILSIGLNIAAGDAGLLDLGYAAFFAIGAYTMGLLTTPSVITCGWLPAAEPCDHVVSFWAALPISSIVTALSGVLLGLPVLRLRPEFLAIVTLSFGELARLIFRADDFRPLFGAAQGITNVPRPILDLAWINTDWRFRFDGEIGYYYLIVLAILLTLAAATRLRNSRIGRAWHALRVDALAAAGLGIRLDTARLLAFTVSAAVAGLVGALAAVRLYGVYPDNFSFQITLFALSLVVIAHGRSLRALVIGGVVLIGLPELIGELANYRLLVLGLVLIFVMHRVGFEWNARPARRSREVRV